MEIYYFFYWILLNWKKSIVVDVNNDLLISLYKLDVRDFLGGIVLNVIFSGKCGE